MNCDNLRKTISKPQESNWVRELGSAVMLLAAQDYLKGNDDKKQTEILDDLESDWMMAWTNGLSKIIMEKLITNPADIKSRLRKNGGFR